MAPTATCACCIQLFVRIKKVRSAGIAKGRDRGDSALIFKGRC